MKNKLLLVALLPVLWACSSSDTQMKGNGDGFVQTQETQDVLIDTTQNKLQSGANLVSSEVQHIGTADFKIKIFDFEKNQKWMFKGVRPCIVDFYADWCGPCKMLSPTMDALAKQYAGQIDFYKVNIDKEPELAQVFQVSSIPALLFCPIKNQPQMSAGLMSKEDLQKVITEFLLKK